jgi:guanosine-3',5'-bis(diphosphate) 3'-pyrophosphohydrolase
MRKIGLICSLAICDHSNIAQLSIDLLLQKVTDAFLYALERHVGQYRKDNSTPYIVHPFRVFLWLADRAKVYDEDVLAAAFLHDLIEDTKTDYDDLEEKFGKQVAGIVAILSKDKRLSEKVREKRFNEQLEKASWRAKIVKIADIYDNHCDMENWSTSQPEKKEKLEEKIKQLQFLGKNLPSKYKPIFNFVRDELLKSRASL